MAVGKSLSDEARREFEWQLTLGDNRTYSQIEVKLVISARDEASQPALDRVMACTRAAEFLESLAREVRHMAQGVETNVR